jgi:hypothetical protein
LTAAEILRQNGVERVREVRNYVGHIPELGDLAFRVEDGGTAGDNRWLVDVQDNLGQQVAVGEADSLSGALNHAFIAIKARLA